MPWRPSLTSVTLLVIVSIPLMATHTHTQTQLEVFLLGIVGTVEEAQSADYLKNMIYNYKHSAASIPGAPKFDIWIQQETGSHRFDIMDHSK